MPPLGISESTGSNLVRGSNTSIMPILMQSTFKYPNFNTVDMYLSHFPIKRNYCGNLTSLWPSRGLCKFTDVDNFIDYLLMLLMPMKVNRKAKVFSMHLKKSIIDYI